MTPKSLLRHPQAVSNRDELTNGRFRTVMSDQSVNEKKVRKVVLTSGKLYYDLLKARDEQGTPDVALVRLEQYHPLPLDELAKVLKQYPAKAELVWAQEEPRNQGAWTFLNDALFPQLDRAVSYVGRAPSASPAPGTAKRFMAEQEKLVMDALK